MSLEFSLGSPRKYSLIGKVPLFKAYSLEVIACTS